MIRRPHLSRRVLEGLASISARTRATTDSEFAALQWIDRARDWRAATIAPLVPQDAESVSQSARAASPAALAGAEGGDA